MLSLYGSISEENKDKIQTGNTFFIALYFVELLIRILTQKGLRNFLNDRRGQEYQMQARCTVLLVVSGVIIQILYYTMPEAQTKLMVGLSCVQLFRIYMTTPSFRRITFCFVIGIPFVKVLVLLLGVCIYLACAVAFFLFEGIPGMPDEMPLNFSTLEDRYSPAALDASSYVLSQCLTMCCLSVSLCMPVSHLLLLYSSAALTISCCS